MRGRSLIGPDCGLTLHLCQRAESRCSVARCHNMIGPTTRGGNPVSVWSLCASCSSGDTASSIYLLQVWGAILIDPLFTCLRLLYGGETCSHTALNLRGSKCFCWFGLTGLSSLMHRFSLCLFVRLQWARLPLPILFSGYIVVRAGIDLELCLCVVTGAFSHRLVAAESQAGLTMRRTFIL